VSPFFARGTRRHVLGVIVASLVIAMACGRRAPEVAGVPEVVDFNFHVKPILSDRCFKCHGPDERARKASLRLDRKDVAFGTLPSGHRAIVPGSLRRSELVARILSTDPKFMMPAPESNLSLTDFEKAVLVRWIEQGADWKPHWSLIPPRKPAVPAVRQASWPRGDLDRFVLATLESKGLEPSPEVSRETWLRRATLDLTGLPPTLEAIDAFVADRSPDAYEKVVDRLLASPAYGEQMAAEWLDVARYADSHGYQDDGMRQMWPWRDWVISAFNRNLRFDTFITWQLAGDLLPQPSQEQRLATGFNRNHMQTQEGGVVPEEYRTEYVVDRVNTFGRAFLGLSVECARCHDHKYDPITQKEFYRLYNFFNNNNETGQIAYSGVPSPTVLLVDDEARAKLDRLRAEAARLEREIAALGSSPGYATWIAKGEASRLTIAGIPGLVTYLPLDGSRTGHEMTKPEPGSKEKPERIEYRAYENLAPGAKSARLGGDKDRVPRTVAGHVGRAQELVGDSHIEAKDTRTYFERNDAFAISLWLRIDRKGATGPVLTRSGGLFDGNRGYEIILRADGTFSAALNHVFPDNSIEIETTRSLAPGDWHHLALTYDGSSRARGLHLFFDGQLAPSHVVVDNLHQSILKSGDKKNESWVGNPPLRIGRRHDETLQDVTVDELRVYDRQLTTFEVQTLAGAEDALGAVLRRPESSRTESERAALIEYYVERVSSGFAPLSKSLSTARGKQNEILTFLPEVMAMRELPKPRPTFVLARGAYDAPTERVTPGTPHAISDFPSTLPQNRLGLARWLLSPHHPLTARVIVNRYWAMFFGRGLVATLADFGNQGRLPSHPQLLDWLATTFVDSGWNLKALQKQIVLSATYRQASTLDPKRLEQDPANEWLARGPSYRLAAEQIRDSALAASGLLVTKIGGPSVYPYQPPGLWEALATRNATKYEQGHGADLYRRSLYTVWKRSSPPPSAISFDAAERLFCTVNRQRTNTPLQSLVLLNDPQYLEAARVLAERMIRAGGSQTRDRVTFAFRLLTSRRPDQKELELLDTLYADMRREYTRDRRAALKLLSVGQYKRHPSLDPGDVAGATMVATTIMNFDEAVYKR
jgi:Protein of unknown function (DUF1553)/Protein of unknown function (DUF1549)/Concanavalin A-like lectin/glucanases superfamily/Planctomycete cytochrome C